MSLLIQQWDKFIRSFKDKRILTVLVYEGMFIIALLLIGILLYSYIGDLAQQALSLTPISAETQITTPADQLNFVSAVKIQIGYMISVTLAIILVLMIFLSSRFMIYSYMLNNKRTGRFYAKNIFVSLLTGLVAILIGYIVQAILFFIFASHIYQRWAQFTIFILFAIAFVFIMYFLINFKLRFFKEQAFIAGLKSFYKDNIKGIKNYLMAIMYSLMLFLALNLVTYYLMFIPGRAVFLIIFTIVLFLYFAWLRSYYQSFMNHKKKLKKIRKKR